MAGLLGQGVVPALFGAGSHVSQWELTNCKKQWQVPVVIMVAQPQVAASQVLHPFADLDVVVPWPERRVAAVAMIGKIITVLFREVVGMEIQHGGCFCPAWLIFVYKVADLGLDLFSCVMALCLLTPA